MIFINCVCDACPDRKAAFMTRAVLERPDESLADLLAALRGSGWTVLCSGQRSDEARLTCPACARRGVPGASG